MKTPDEVARDTLGADALNGIGYQQYLPYMVEAIIKDRAERADMLTREARILAFYRKHATEMASPGGYTDDDGEHYDLTALLHNLSRAQEAMLIAAGVPSSDAFRQAFT